MNTALFGATALIAVVLLGSAALGAALLAWCPGRGRPTSMAPTLGVAVIVLWLSAVGLLVPPGSWVGVGTTAVAATGLLVVTVILRLPALREVIRGLRGLLAPVLIGLLCALPFLLIISQARSTAVVHLTGNHDAFFFTAVPEWLRDHTLIGSPGVAVDGNPTGTPLIGSTWDLVQDGSLRVGSESLTAATSRAIGADPLNLWLPISLTHLVLLSTAAHALVSSLGVRGWRAPAIAGVAAGSAAVIDAVLDQHTPTLLATAALIVLVAELLRGATLTRSGASPLIVAIGGGTVAAVYGELFALTAIPLVVLVTWPWWRRRRVDGRWLAAVLGWSLIVAAAPWARALGGATGGKPPEGYRSAFAAESGWFNGLHALANGSSQAVHTWAGSPTTTRLLVLAFAVLLAAGLVAMCMAGRARAFWVAMVANLLAGWWVLGLSQHSGYPQQRLVEWSVPLLVIGAALGWVRVADRLTGRMAINSPSAARWVGGSLLGVALVVLAVPGVRHAVEIEDEPARRVDQDFAALADWVDSRDPAGHGTVVLAQDYFTNLWTPYALRHQPNVSYLTIYRDYYDLDHFGPISERRWLILDRSAAHEARIPDDALVEANQRFVMVDLTAGPVVLEVPPLHRGRWSAEGVDVTVSLAAGTVECHAADQVLPCT